MQQSKNTYSESHNMQLQDLTADHSFYPAITQRPLPHSETHFTGLTSLKHTNLQTRVDFLVVRSYKYAKANNI